MWPLKHFSPDLALVFKMLLTTEFDGVGTLFLKT
jgi:hypothetical protein